MRKILLIEDNVSIIKGLEYLLSKQYAFSYATSKKEALVKLAFPYDLIILDIMLQDGDGFEIAQKIQHTPIIFLSAKDDESDIVNGLKLGEDYIVKPFRNQELLLRIEKVLQRSQKDIVSCGKLVVDKNQLRVLYAGKYIEFTSIEYKIVELLVTNANQIIPRERLLERIWDINEQYVNDNTLSVNMRRIRAKLGEDVIRTIKGVGYMVSTNE